MSQQQTSDTGSQTDRRSGPSRARRGEVSPQEDGGQGRTTSADTVVTKIASMATRDVPGVYDLGGGMARTMGGIQERIPGSRGPSTTQGVSVEVGERQAAVDIDVVIEYGVPIAEVARGIRRGVIEALERMTGLEVVEVNIAVDDIDIPGDETGASGAQSDRVE